VVFRETIKRINDDSPEDISVTPWVSTDGQSWQQGQPPDVAGLDDTDTFAAVAEGPAGLVAVGRGAFTDDAGEIEDAVIGLWTSTDGKVWERVDLAKTFGVQALGDVAAGPFGYIASNLSASNSAVAPAVWLSADGRKWRSVALAKGSLAGGHLAHAYVLPAGYMLAGWQGVPVGEDLDTTPAIWTSTDGVTWREAKLPGVVAAPQKEAVVEPINAGHYVALVGDWSCGCEPPPDYQAWNSTDGSSWHAAPVASFGDISDGRKAMRLAHPDSGGTASVETTPDGLAWSTLAVSGAGPADGQMAYGPAGLMIESYDDGSFWLAKLP
jgi:hypothetical protein